MTGLIINQDRCTLCGNCLATCFYQALRIKNKLLEVNENCTLCAACIEACHHKALKINRQAEDCKIVKQDWQDILVFAEHREGKIQPVTFELLGKALELAAPLAYQVNCLLIGHDLSSVAVKLAFYALHQIFVYDQPAFHSYRSDVFANAFADCLAHLKPAVVLIGGTEIGKSIAPVIATRFQTGLTADCTELELQKNTDLIQIRPAFGGNVMARIKTPQTRPQLATVRYKVMNKAQKQSQKQAKIVNCRIKADKLHSDLEIIKEETVPITPSLSEAKVIIAAGQGFLQENDLQLVTELAQLLKAQVACSRALVEKGWLPYDKQIGLSGKTVKPDLIMTCAISGSVQFMAGMKNSKMIIAINNDQNAPLFSIAHHPIRGDIYEILPDLIKKIKMTG